MPPDLIPLLGIPVVVLAAGRGSRMGIPKPLMRIDGELWWCRQHHRLTAYGLDQLWVVSGQVAAAMRSDPTPRLVTADSDAPMFVSVLLGLAALGPCTRGVFILPVDTPAPGPEHWLAIAGSPLPAHPTYEGRGGHPLYLPGSWVRQHLAERVARVRSRGITPEDRTLRLDKLIEPVRRRIPVDDPAVVLNLNTPADLRALRTGAQ